MMKKINVEDPDSLYPYPASSESGSGSRVLRTKKLKQKSSSKNIVLAKNCNLLVKASFKGTVSRDGFGV